MRHSFVKPLVVVVLAIVLGNGLFAQAPNGYYNNAIGKRGEELRIALHDIIDDHATISYQQIWNAFWMRLAVVCQGGVRPLERGDAPSNRDRHLDSGCLIESVVSRREKN